MSGPRAWSLHDALVWLEGHVNLEAVEMGRAGPPTMDRIFELVKLLGDPQRDYRVVHITGTNGKGSTARMVTALLRAVGLRVGTYTSPDLQCINERLAYDGEPIGGEDLAEALGLIALLEPEMREPPFRFEILTAAALRWFADMAVDVAVVEVGLGGRRDPTNVVDAKVAVVTNVSLDHAEVIGPGLSDIAREKAGIVKPRSTLVLGETSAELAPIFREAGASAVVERGEGFGCDKNLVAHGGRMLELRTPRALYPEVYLPLHGAHQGENAALALSAAEELLGAPLPATTVCDAFAAVRSPGRMEVLARHPLVVIDGAHNPAGAAAAGATLDEELVTPGLRLVVMGLLRGRDPGAMLDALGPDRIGLLVACRPPSPRALAPEALAAACGERRVPVEVVEDVAAALSLALERAGPDDLVFVTGSLYVVGEARTAALGRQGAPGRVLPPHWS